MVSGASTRRRQGDCEQRDARTGEATCRSPSWFDARDGVQRNQTQYRASGPPAWECNLALPPSVVSDMVNDDEVRDGDADSVCPTGPIAGSCPLGSTERSFSRRTTTIAVVPEWIWQPVRNPGSVLRRIKSVGRSVDLATRSIEIQLPEAAGLGGDTAEPYWGSGSRAQRVGAE